MKTTTPPPNDRKVWWKVTIRVFSLVEVWTEEFWSAGWTCWISIRVVGDTENSHWLFSFVNEFTRRLYLFAIWILGRHRQCHHWRKFYETVRDAGAKFSPYWMASTEDSHLLAWRECKTYTLRWSLACFAVCLRGHFSSVSLEALEVCLAFTVQKPSL